MLTPLPGFLVAIANAYSVTVDPTNQFLYVGNSGAGSVSGLELNGATGGLTPMPGSAFVAGDQPDFVATL